MSSFCGFQSASRDVVTRHQRGLRNKSCEEHTGTNRKVYEVDPASYPAICRALAWHTPPVLGKCEPTYFAWKFSITAGPLTKSDKAILGSTKARSHHKGPPHSPLMINRVTTLLSNKATRNETRTERDPQQPIIEKKIGTRPRWRNCQWIKRPSSQNGQNRGEHRAQSYAIYRCEPHTVETP